MSLVTINNQNVKDAIGSEFEAYQQTLAQFKETTSLQVKRDLYDRMKDLVIQMIQNLDEDCNGTDTTSLQQICWMSLQNHEFNLTIPSQDAVAEEQQAMEEAMEKTVQPIWRPDTKYYVRFRLKDEVDDGEDEGIYDYYYGFKTAGPVGHFHNAPGVVYGNEYDASGDILNRKDENGVLDINGTLTNRDQYPLTSLRQYIDYNKSYPNADGSLLQAKPIFYGNNQCKISIYFTKPLAYHMVNKWNQYQDPGSANDLPELAGNMHVAIKDPVTNMVIPYPLPVGFDQSLIPIAQTFATWFDVDWTEVQLPDDEEVQIPDAVTVVDAGGNTVGTYDILLAEYRAASQTQHIRIDDDAALANDTGLNLVGGKLQWNSNGTNVEYTIVTTGEEDATWNTDGDPRIPVNLQVLNNMIDYVNDNISAIQCELRIGDPIVPNSYSYNVTLTNLKPSKLYTALIYNAYDTSGNGLLEDTESKQVHQYVFQTSRYENFAEQVNSYWLRELDEDGAVVQERQAVFEFSLAIDPTDLDAAYNIVAGTPDNDLDLELQFFDLFDRTVEGLLGFNPVDPPINTEFNLLKNASDDDKVVGLLIRNPEPFNIPKIPLEEIQGSIEVLNDPNNDYKVLYSKDYSQALIMHTSKEITAETLDIQFQYKAWNGTGYEISDTVTIENIQLNQ
jgi:hypothetical protein